VRRHVPDAYARANRRQRCWLMLKCQPRLHRKARSRQHIPLRQLLIRHQTATLCRGWR